MLQTICDCGRIAEVRHRSNGAKLAYTHCIKCGGGPVSAAKAALIESTAKSDIGNKGDIYEQSSKNGQSESVDVSLDYKPAREDLPENLESESQNSQREEQNESESKSEKTSNKSKFLTITALCAAFIGGGVYLTKKIRG